MGHSERVLEERRRLLGEGVAGVAEIAAIELSVGSADSGLLLQRCREVMEVVLRHDEQQDWPTLAGWRRELPEWFVVACGPEQSGEEAQRWLVWWKSLPPAEQGEVEDRQPWALSDWLEWLQPSERTWYWLGAEKDGPHRLRVWLDVDGSPAPIGALEWLLKAAGATEIEVA
jgi:hypothetical protein